MPFSDLECLKIEGAERDVLDRKEAYLHASGWEHTSQTVGSYWRWFKTIDGRGYGCETNEAFRIQDNIDREAYARAHPEEFND
jgi:hypothetical protein